MAKKKLGPGVELLKNAPVSGDNTPEGGELLRENVEVAIKAALVEMGHPYLGVQCYVEQDGSLTCEAIHMHQKVPDHWMIDIQSIYGGSFGAHSVTAVIIA
jgi:hypothetical protein